MLYMRFASEWSFVCVVNRYSIENGGGYQNSAYLYTFLQWLVAKWINMEYLIENEIVCLFVLFYVLKWMENDEVKWVR